MKKLSKRNYFFYGLGIVILSLGIALTIQSQLGTSPFDALLVGLAENIGLTVGSWEIILAIIIIMLNSLLINKRPELLGLVTAILTGVGIDLWLLLIEDIIIPELWLGKLIYFIIGLILLGLGTAIYLYTNFAPAPIDQLMLIIRELTKISILYSRTLQYLLFIVLAVIVNGPIGIGTVITLFIGGPILNYFMPLVECKLDRLLITESKLT
ncbi:MAG: YitT family protein [Psychrobacillus psychrodurans]